MKFSLVIPCYNEAENLPLLLERCKQVTRRSDIEVILVDNGSTDATPKILKDLLPYFVGCRSIQVEKNVGYGFGILAGLQATKGEIVGWTHADMQTDPKDFLTGLALFEQHGLNIFVKGRRYGRPILDVFFTIAMSCFESLLLRQALWDINAQPTMFAKSFFLTWEDPPLDFSLDLYAYFQAHRNKLARLRFPVNFAKRAHGTSHWNVNFPAKWKFIRRTISFSLNLRKSLRP
jgi:glycosyltransferase involved in cell wall biosynthesis